MPGVEHAQPSPRMVPMMEPSIPAPASATGTSTPFMPASVCTPRSLATGMSTTGTPASTITMPASGVAITHAPPEHMKPLAQSLPDSHVVRHAVAPHV